MSRKKESFIFGFDSPSFIQSRPILLVTLMNKLGSIAMSVVPIMLVERGFGAETSSWVMGSIRSALLIGLFLSGIILDRVGGRLGMILAFLLVAVGFGFMPFFEQAGLIALFGIIAHFGDAMSRISIRLLITESVGRNYQKEALGWMRMVNNLGQILSFSVGALAAKFGVFPLFILDAVTGLLAAIVGGRILPKPMRHERHTNPNERVNVPKRQIFAFFGCAIILFAWSFYYGLYEVGVAARLERLAPGEGLRIFSTLMILNTIMVTFFAVRATAWFEKPSVVFPMGLFLTFLGLAVSIYGVPNVFLLFVGTFLVTWGEIQLGAIGQFLLIRLLPTQRAVGPLYSSGMVISQLGKIVSAAIVFPWLVHSDELESSMILLLVLFFVFASFALVFRKDFDHAAAN